MVALRKSTSLTENILYGKMKIQKNVITSNRFSKNYTIVFKLDNSGLEKLVFHMQANEVGEVYINSFSAYVENYGS